MPIVPLVHLVGGKCLLRRGSLPGEGDVAELDAEVTAEADVRMVGPVCAQGPGQRGIILEDSRPGQLFGLSGHG